MKCGKRILYFLYALYVVVTVVNVVFQLGDVQNGLIGATGIFGKIITCALSILLAIGFFAACTAVQLIVYRAKKSGVYKNPIPWIMLEIIKVAGNSVYIYMIDYANIRAGGVVTAFIISGMVLFAAITVLETALFIVSLTK